MRNEMIKVYKSKIDWWVYALLVLMVGSCLVGPLLEGDDLAGVVMAVLMAALWLFCCTGVRYEIRGNMLGIRNLYRWTWLPINQISEVKLTKGIVATAALSLDRISIKFSERSVMNGIAPVEISPRDRRQFAEDLKMVNPNITII